MDDRTARRRFRPACHPLEPRDLPDAAALAAVAVGLYGSPVAVAARAAALGYQVGQLAWNGQTNFLLGSLQVTQPFPLKSAWGHRPNRHPHVRPNGLPLPNVQLREPSWLAHLAGLGRRTGPRARP